MKSTKKIPIMKECNKQQMIDAICAEMIPIDEKSNFYKEKKVSVETKGMVTILQVHALNNKEQKVNFQSVKLVFNEGNCKVTLEWPLGVALEDERLKSIGIVMGFIAFLLLWIPAINMLITPIIIVLGILYFVIMLLLDKKKFSEFQKEIYEIIESYL